MLESVILIAMAAACHITGPSNAAHVNPLLFRVIDDDFACVPHARKFAADLQSSSWASQRTFNDSTSLRRSHLSGPSGKSRLEANIETGNVARLQLIAAAGAPLTPIFGVNAFRYAIDSGDTELLSVLLAAPDGSFDGCLGEGGAAARLAEGLLESTLGAWAAAFKLSTKGTDRLTPLAPRLHATATIVTSHWLFLRAARQLDLGVGVCTACAVGNVSLVQQLLTLTFESGLPSAVQVERSMTGPFKVAALYGHLDIIEWIYTTLQRREASEVVRLCFHMWVPAIVGGHAHVLDWLVNEVQSTPAAQAAVLDLFGQESFSGAAEYGHAHVLEWLREGAGGRMFSSAFEGAAKAGRLDMMLWLDERKCSWAPSVARIAVENDHMHILEYALTRHRPPADTLACLRAVSRGDLAALRLLRSHGAGWAADCIAEAIRLSASTPATHMEVFKWLLENNAPRTGGEDAIASKYANFVALHMLRERGAPLRYDTCCYMCASITASSSDVSDAAIINMLDWLFKNGPIISSDVVASASIAASRAGRAAVIAWLSARDQRSESTCNCAAALAGVGLVSRA